jgi:uncharacterized protein YggU (UPF0235/DUF167 family)
MFALPLRVKPGASRTAVGGAYSGPYGPALVVAVQAPAVDGRATDAALRAVAKALGVRPRTVTLRSGETSRDKLVMVDDDSAEVRAAELRDGAAAR